MEIWKEIPNYTNYEVSSIGRVRNKKTNRILSVLENKGYLSVAIYNDCGRKYFLIHRLVGKVFLKKPNELRQINHKDENPKNNSVNNLEWCTAKYNVNFGGHNRRCRESLQRSGKGWIGRKHSQESKIKMSAKKIGKSSLRKKAVLINSEIVMPSLTECAAFLNLSITQVYNVINGMRHSDTLKLKYLEE